MGANRMFSVIMKTLILLLLAASAQATKHNTYKQDDICDKSYSCQRSCYRTYDGSCNNQRHPKWGTAYSPYARLTKDSYSDGFHAFPRSVCNETLTNPRLVSLKVSPDVIVKDPKWTVITLQWGQIVAHDMSLTAGVPQTGVDDIICCQNGEPIPQNPVRNCAPIPLPKCDPYNAPEGNTCINFVRTDTYRDKNCSLLGKPEEPLSQVTAYLDLSIVYGNSIEQANTVRAFEKGKLKYVERNGERWLPQDTNPLACNNVRDAKEPCYFAGDVRVNQNPHLAFLQNILMREHNRIAEKLCIFVNPHWDDEKCFQEARRILIAKAQHITYYEFLHIFLGFKNMVDRGLAYPNAIGFIDDYDPSVNAQTLNEHATAAYRALHTLIVGRLKLYSECRKFVDEIRLSDWFNRPSVIEEYPAGLARGLCTQPQNSDDRFYDAEVSQFFFRELNASIGQDLHAIDIQRSRDHGVGTYVDTLYACGLGRPKTFRDLEKYIKREYVELLMQVYKNVKDIELAVAGLLERKVEGTLSGPTFLCVMLEQFGRTRFGDKYFFEHGNTVGALNIEQLNSIRKATMSRMVCDNVKGVESMQPRAFEKISKANALAPCFTLPRENLWLWKEYPKMKNKDASCSYKGNGQ